MASSVGNAIGAVGGYMKYYEGRKMQKEAQKRIDNFQWEELENSYKNNQVSTLGADLQVEENNRASAGAVDALRASGTRGLVGGLGRVQAQNNAVNRDIAVNLDQQQKAIDFAASADDSVIRAMIENRQANELAGYGQMLNTGMNMKYGGIADVMNAWQAQGQTESAVFDKVTGMMSGGAMGGGGGGQQMPMSGKYGNGMSTESVGQNKMSTAPDYTKIYGGAFNGMNYGMGRGGGDETLYGFGY